MMPLNLVVQFLGEKNSDFNLLLFRVSTVLQGSFNMPINLSGTKT